MNEINKMIVAIYQSNQKRMKYSEGNVRLFFAKLAFCVFLWIWLLPILMLVERSFREVDIIYNLPNGRVFAFLILIMIYIPLNYFTWKLKEADEYLTNKENEDSINKAKRLFFILLVFGFIFLIAVAKYNQGNPLSD